MWSQRGSRMLILSPMVERAKTSRTWRFRSTDFLRCASISSSSTSSASTSTSSSRTSSSRTRGRTSSSSSSSTGDDDNASSKGAPDLVRRRPIYISQPNMTGMRSPSSRKDVVDVVPAWHTNTRKVSARLPTVHSLEEFPKPSTNRATRRQQATMRILKIAAERLMDPPTLHLLAFSFWTTLGIAAVEGTILCQEWPVYESTQAGKFVVWYSIEQLIPSMVWSIQDPVLVCQSLALEPSSVLRELSGNDAESATTLLRTNLLATTRFFVAGFMMIASIVRAAGVSAGAFAQYEERIRQGREPPLRVLEQDHPGIVLRLCGRDSYTTEVSLERMGVHLFPVFEFPDRVQYLVWHHSEQLRRPIYWCVREGKYGSSFSWDRFPADPSSFLKRDDTGERILVLEADATNAHDPLALGNAALDLTLDDASQGFRRIQERFTTTHPGVAFQTLRVYLGNSMEIARTGGGHSYTLRHRVRYAKEVDVLLDSRAPVLQRILEWCRKVASGNDRRILFQTSSRAYFTSLQQILRCYGYEIYDPLDLRTGVVRPTHSRRRKNRRQSQQEESEGHHQEGEGVVEDVTTERDQVQLTSLLHILMTDPHLDGIWQERGALELFNSSLAAPQNTTEQTNTTDHDQEQPWSTTGTDHNDDDDDDHHHHQEQQPWQTTDDDTTTTTTTTTSDMLRHVTKMAKLPRLVHMPTTAETVNAVEALITAGEVDATNCCAILERQEGVTALEYVLQRKSDLVRDEEKVNSWIHRRLYDDESTTSSSNNGQEEEGKDDTHEKDNKEKQVKPRRNYRNGLQMICTSTIYDDLFRQVRMWARMGFSHTQIQKEMDQQFHEMLEHTHTARKDDILEALEQEEEEKEPAMKISSKKSAAQQDREGPHVDPSSTTS